jgi:hypothetical protein
LITIPLALRLVVDGVDMDAGSFTPFISSNLNQQFARDRYHFPVGF